jgi:GNAT superfamily N-acetyltransferase
MGHVRRQGRRARLAMLYVDADRRRGGIGGALVAAQGRWALAAGIADLVCHIPDVSAAAGLAHASGWRRTDEVFVTRHRLEERKWVKDQRTASVDPGGRRGG